MPPSVPERERLAALASYDILDTPPEEPFDRIAQLMAWGFHVPTAAVAFMDAERMWAKATTGLNPTTPRAQSFCIHVVTSNEPLVVEDARRDPRFAKTPLVTEHGVRFFAGAPVQTPAGLPIGTVSLYDTEPRSVDPEATDRLAEFAALTTNELERRRGSRELAPTESVRLETTRPADPPSAPPSAFDVVARLTSDGLLRLDAEGRIQWVNDRFVEMAGYTRDELQGRRPGQLLHGPATSDDTVAAIHEHIERSEPFSVEILNYRKSGVQYWVQTDGEPLFDDDGTCTGFLIVETEVTERRQQEDALTALTSFYELALTELPIEVAVMDPEGHYLFVNPAAVGDEEMREWLIGKTAVDYARRRDLDPEPFERRVNWIRGVVDAKEPDSFEDPVVTSEGETRHILRVAHPVTDESGTVVRVFAYGVDLTERKEYEQKLVDAKERAQEMNRLKTAFLANMSHEIRTPLTSIIGFAEVLGEEITGQKREMAELIQRSGVRLKQTLTSVLDLARLEGDAMELSPQRLDLVTRARETAELLRPQVQANDLELTLDLPNSPIEVQVDKAAFDRVLTNLLTNAIKFTQNGQIVVTLQRSAEAVELIVADTGIGISESFLERIFDAFEQESEGTTRDYEGIGLGLTITKQLVDLMDGTLDIESTKGEGTTVTVTLPSDGT